MIADRCHNILHSSRWYTGGGLCRSSHNPPEHAVFNGWVQALVRPQTGARGTLRVTARAEGLEPVGVELKIR